MLNNLKDIMPSKYPLIILGAGASHDYSPFATPKPPLTSDLVNREYFNAVLANQYSEAADILSQIGAMLDSRQYSNFEECLTHISENLGSGNHRKLQLIGLMFYLRDFFSLLSENPDTKSRYRVLKNHINDYGGRACVVNFNYDTLFEKSLDGAISRIGDYVNGNIKVFKPHGSHDWAYVTRIYTDELRLLDDTSSYSYLKNNPDHFDSLRRQGANPYHIDEITKNATQNTRLLNFPAIAIPIRKKDHFVCPTEHIQRLKRELESVSKILIIGWSGKDPLLIEMMESINKKAPIFIVSKDEEGALEVAANIKEVSPSLIENLSFHYMKSNFAGFIGSKECETFFAL